MVDLHPASEKFSNVRNSYTKNSLAIKKYTIVIPEKLVTKVNSRFS